MSMSCQGPAFCPAFRHPSKFFVIFVVMETISDLLLPSQPVHFIFLQQRYISHESKLEMHGSHLGLVSCLLRGKQLLLPKGQNVPSYLCL